MKRLIFFLSFITCSCAFLIRPEIAFVIENQTPEDFTIYTFAKSKLLDSIYIHKGGKYVKKSRYDHSKPTSPFNREKVDSLIIIFSNGKGFRQYCNGERLISANVNPVCRPQKNLMDFNTGTFKNKNFSSKSSKTITFDESDYNKAIDF